MLDKVASVLCIPAEVAPEAIGPDQNLVDDLGLCSLDVMSIVIDLEDIFGIEIPDRHISKFVTVGDIVEYLKERTGEKTT